MTLADKPGDVAGALRDPQADAGSRTHAVTNGLNSSGGWRTAASLNAKARVMR